MQIEWVAFGGYIVNSFANHIARHLPLPSIFHEKSESGGSGRGYEAE